MDDPRPSNQEIRDALKAICDSEVFEIKNTVREMLGFIVDSWLAGRDINEDVMLVEFFKRDPAVETNIVRSNAQNLRNALAEYYDNQGRREEVRISVPRGGYRADIYYSKTARQHAELERREALLLDREREIERRHAEFDRKVAEFEALQAKREAAEAVRQAEYDSKLAALESKLTRQIQKESERTEERARNREKRIVEKVEMTAEKYDPHDSY